MDIRFIIVIMVIAIVMDFLGRMARKRQGLLPPDQDGAVDDADALNALTGVEPEAPGPRARPTAAVAPKAPQTWDLPPARPTGEQFRRGDRRDRVAAAREAVETIVTPIVKPEPKPAAKLPAPAAEVPLREARVLELRDRSPREIPVRSRDPRGREKPPAPAERPRVEVVPQPARPVRVAPKPAGSPAEATAARDRGGRLGLGSAAGLRRAVLIREVLGPPLALRDDGEPGPGTR